MKLEILLACLAAVFLILFSTFTGASEFDYTLRDGNRREGFRNDIPTASLDLHIISFISYRENRSPLSKDFLKLKFYVPSEDQIFISVSEIVPLRHYYMEPVQTKWAKGWQVFAGWPVNAILLPQGIPTSSLGVVARLKSNEPGGGLLAPVLFYSSQHPPLVSSYELRVVSREMLSTLSYQLKRWQSATVHSTKLVSEDPNDFIAAGTPIALRLNLEGEPEGWFELWLDARIKDQIDGPRRTYYFYHQPEIGQKQ